MFLGSPRRHAEPFHANPHSPQNSWKNPQRPEQRDFCVPCVMWLLPDMPDYQFWRLELDSPRGRIYLIKDMLEKTREFG